MPTKLRTVVSNIETISCSKHNSNSSTGEIKFKLSNNNLNCSDNKIRPDDNIEQDTIFNTSCTYKIYKDSFSYRNQLEEMFISIHGGSDSHLMRHLSYEAFCNDL